MKNLLKKLTVEIYLSLKAIIKLIIFNLIMATFLFHAAFIFIFYYQSFDRRKKLIYLAHRYAKKVITSYGVNVQVINPINENEVSLLVGNHLGFIDIMCLVSVIPCVFVTSLEMKNTPILGQVTEMAGCAYVNRKNRMNIQIELIHLAEVLKKGYRIVLYAESTTSNGELVLPFKKTLLMSAAHAGVPIRPFVFNVLKINNKPKSIKNRDAICWYGDMSFLKTTWLALKLDQIDCEIEFLPLVEVNIEDDRKNLSESLHAKISAKFRPFQPEL